MGKSFDTSTIVVSEALTTSASNGFSPLIAPMAPIAPPTFFIISWRTTCGSSAAVAVVRPNPVTQSGSR